MRRLLPFIPALAVALAIAVTISTSKPSQAQTPPTGGGGKGPLVIDVTNPRRDLYKIAVPRLIGNNSETGKIAAEVISGDLYSSGWFKVLDPRSFLAHLEAEGTNINIQDWRNIGAEGVSKGQATVYQDVLSLDFKLYEIGRGPAAVLEKQYKGPASQARAFAHAWSAEVVKYFTGEDSFFTTQIAFSGPSGTGSKDVYVMDYDGVAVHKITNNGSQNILPAWSPSGGQIAFTSFLRGNPDLYVTGLGGGRPKRISSYPGVNMGACYSPDGNTIAATLSRDGNPEIYLLGTDGSIQKRLTDNAFIDASPNWSADGSQLAFVSNRYGSPQIWTMSSSGAGQARITHRGTYNQEPSWCPKCAVPTVAYTARDEKGVFDVFTIEVATGNLVRLTEGQGSNEHPSWAPNGRGLVMTSSRGGLWLTTSDGKQQRQVYRGGASTPVWGPPKK